MPSLPGRVPEEARALARRRLDSLTVPRGEAPARAVVGPPPLRTRVAARLPTTVRDGRVAVSRSAAAGLAAVAVAGVALAIGYAWQARAVPAVVPAVAPSGPVGTAAGTPSAAASGSSPSPTAVLVVDVAGRVLRPGVVTLPVGSRVVDAIAAAGGVRGRVDLTTLNLARPLVDGEQVLVGVRPTGASPPGPTGTAAPSTSDGAVIDLNAATLEQLDSLPGVGPVLAQRILDWRTAHGRFSTIDELREVSGIGESRFADLAPHVRV